MIDIRLDQLNNAHQILKKQNLTTPLIPLHLINTPSGNQIYLKAECLQPAGSFKMRGATYCMSRLSPEQRSKGVIAYSTGNHAQAVALAASKLGIRSTIVMSPDAMQFKVAATCRYGAEVVMVSAEERQKHTEELANSTGAYLIPPFDHPDVITGQGTIGLEIIQQMAPAAIFVPVGGGGLISGIALAVKLSMPDVMVIGVEPELENDGYRSFKEGKRIGMTAPSNTIADAVKIPMLGKLTFPIMQKYVDDMVTVNEGQIADATLMITEMGHLVAEPAGALGLAAALQYPKKFAPNRPIVCVVSGGNTMLSQLCPLKAQSQPIE